MQPHSLLHSRGMEEPHSLSGYGMAAGGLRRPTRGLRAPFCWRIRAPLHPLSSSPTKLDWERHSSMEIWTSRETVFSVFSIAEHLLNRPRALQQRIAEKLAGGLFDMGQRLKHGSVSSRSRDRASIAYHYDQPVAFFKPWLGRSLVYSCAYFHDAEDSLDSAQEQKLEHVCRKLRLRPGERFLDIGEAGEACRCMRPASDRRGPRESH